MKKDKLKRDINLFEAIFKDKTRKSVDITTQIKSCAKIFAAVLAVAVVLLTAMCIFSALRISDLERENAALATPEKLEEIALNKAKVEALTTENQMFAQTLTDFDNSTKLTIQNLKDVAYYQPPNMIVTSISYSEGTLTLNCQGADELTGASFARSLRDSGKFNDVIYTGTAKSDSVYTFSISVQLLSGADESAKSSKGGTK